MSSNDNGDIQVVYHATPIVVFDDKRVILNSNGYRTATTKKKMNQASDQFKLGYQVFQRSYDWFVEYDGQTLPFTDGMILSRS